MKPSVNICWFRRDLRLSDNAALYHSLKDSIPVVPVFIFDTEILDRLEDKTDRRVAFIHAAIIEIQQQLKKLKSTLDVYYGTPVAIFKKILEQYDVKKVFTNHDYEPYAKDRDGQIKQLLAAAN